jgi:myo-inositol 2-dehydrogenase/D-chiro-inositol 1-dehydrogenase
MIRFALFGAGFIGQVHGANIAACPRTKLQYVYDVNVEAANKLAGRFGARWLAASRRSLRRTMSTPC